MNHNEKIAECARFVADEMRDLAQQYCVPIIAVQQGRHPAQCGTGTLFRVADRYFLVSAGHIVHHALDGRATLFLGCGASSDCLPLDRRPYYTPANPERSGDRAGPFDIGIWQLSREQVDRISQRKHFTNNSVVAYHSDMSIMPPRELFYLCGYPTALATFDPTDERGLVVEPIRWVAAQRVDRSSWPKSCEPRYHLVLDANRSVSFDSNSDVVTPPSVPKGISGCAVWSLGWDPVHDTWTPAHARIVGIETRVYSREGLIRATGCVGVRSALMNIFPELGNAFRLQI